MKQILVFITLTLFSLQVSGQGLDTRTKNQVKTKFLNAKKQYENKDYDAVLDKIEEIDDLLVGKPLASVQNLKVKAYIGKGKFEKAKKELYILEGLNLSDGIIEDVAVYSPKIESGLEAERKRKEKIRQEELARQKREHDKKIAAQQLENRKKNIAASMLPEVKKVFHLYNSLEEGKPYLVDYRSKLTSNSSERAVFIFYGNEYIIYTIPSTSVASNLHKDNVSFSSYNAGTGSSTISATIKPSYGDKKLVYFKKGIHFSNVYLGGFGDELLWTEGTQYTEFDKTLYYYYFNSTLSCDIDIKTSFDENYHNPYIETGTITKTIDYELVNDSELYSKLKGEGVTNKRTSNLDNPKGLEITLVPSSNMKMLYPLKKMKYVLKEKITKYNIGGSKYKGTILYFVPKSTSSHYGYIQYGKSYPKKDLFEAITGLSNNFILKETYFNNIYKSFSENIGNGKTRYFTSNDYNTPYWAISKIVDGSRVSLESLYGTYGEETSINSDFGDFDDFMKKYDYLNIDSKKLIYMKKDWVDSPYIVFNSIAWAIYKNSNDPEKLSIAISLIKKSVAIMENYDNTDTYAALLYKTEDYAQALVVAKRAIEIAKVKNINYSVTEELIEKIKDASASGEKPNADLNNPKKEAGIVEKNGSSNDEVFTVVETMPEFPGGGQSALNKYISNNLNYPESAKINGISGRVFVSFVINKNGSISDAKIMKSVNDQLDAEALRIIGSMPSWIPGKQRGEPVRVKYNMPINFRLQ